MRSISFWVAGIAQPKGSLTRMPNGAMIPAGTKASREAKSNWRYDLRQAGMTAMDGDPLFTGAIRLMADITLPSPKLAKYKVGWWPHTKRPDLDKLARDILDPLTGVVWVDDNQVMSLSLNKSYAWDGRPGVNLVIDELDDVALQRLAAHQSMVTQALGRMAHD